MSMRFSVASGALVSERRQVRMRAGRLRDRFDMYETHLYTTDAHLGNRPDKESVRAEIARAEGGRRNPKKNGKTFPEQRR